MKSMDGIMSKFDVMANEELNRFSALNLKHTLWKFIESEGTEKSWHNADVEVRCRMSGRAGSESWFSGIIVDDAGVFLVKTRSNGSTAEAMKARDAVSVLCNVKETHDCDLVVVDITKKRLHQVIECEADDGIMLVLDGGDPMSDELAKLWSEMGKKR